MKQPRLDLFVFADALGWELSKRYSFMEDALTIRNKCETVFGYSSTCDPTILTGTMPFEHDHFSFFVKADEENPSPGKPGHDKAAECRADQAGNSPYRTGKRYGLGPLFRS